MAGQGIGKYVWDFSKETGIDITIAMGFCQHESGCGRLGAAHDTHSAGNIRPAAWLYFPGVGTWDNSALVHYNDFNHPGSDMFIDFSTLGDPNSWIVGWRTYFKLLSELYVADWQYNTIEKITEKYAPWGDNNNPIVYANSVAHNADEYRKKYGAQR
jgi:hypothetical protein